MIAPARFDVLIVYSETLAASASGTKSHTPFLSGSGKESYNLVYGYFLKICRNLNLKAAFTTSADIIGPGFCRSYWKYSRNHWIKVAAPCFSALIFDKFSPLTRAIKSRRQLLFSSAQVQPFNNPDLYYLFFDKQKTYEKLSEHAIPTITLVDKSLHSIDAACKSLTNTIRYQPACQDFTSDFIMKDRFGAGGRHVYKFKAGKSADMLAVVRRNARISFIIQPFANFDQGFSYCQSPAATDIRLIYLNGKIIQSYIRIAKAGDFRCNEHQGGKLSYVTLKDIPHSLIEKSNTIAGILNQKSSLYALDFIISNNGNTYLLEGNTGPGLDWDMNVTKNELKAKKLIRLVVRELTVRAKANPCPNFA